MPTSQIVKEIVEALQIFPRDRERIQECIVLLSMVEGAKDCFLRGQSISRGGVDFESQRDSGHGHLSVSVVLQYLRGFHDGSLPLVLVTESRRDDSLLRCIATSQRRCLQLLCVVRRGLAGVFLVWKYFFHDAKVFLNSDAILVSLQLCSWTLWVVVDFST